MQPRRAILVDGSRILRDLIRRVLETKAGFEVVDEIGTLEELSSSLARAETEWAFLILSPNLEISKRQTVEILVEHPSLRIILLRMDEGRIEMEWLIHGYKDLTEMTLDEIALEIQKELHSGTMAVAKSLGKPADLKRE
ncbi:MAG: hypothetical protein ACOYZ6_08780 [Chloroflexota bacterium]